MARKAKIGKKKGTKKAARKPARAAAKAKPRPKSKASTRKQGAKAKKVTKTKLGVKKSVTIAKRQGQPPRPQKRSNKPAPPATASLILSASSNATAPSAIPRKWQRHHRLLSDLRDTLLEQSGRLVREAHEEAVGHSMHMADAGTDSFDRDFALSLLSADQNALAEIESALKRIQLGEYGVCELTGKPIGAARLEAIPWTRFSYEAQQQLEKSGVDKRVHLGSLRTVHGGDTAETPEVEGEEEEKKEKE